AKVIAIVQTHYGNLLTRSIDKVPRAIFLCCIADELAAADVQPTVLTEHNVTKHPWPSWYRLRDLPDACLAISSRDVADVCRSTKISGGINPDPNVLSVWS